MKNQLVVAIAICFFAFASGFKLPQDWTTKEELLPRSTGPYAPYKPKEWLRIRRHADPQGSLTLEGMKPLSGPDQRLNLNLDYNQRLLNNGRTTADAYGGANWRQGGPVVPHGGMKFDHHFGRNGDGFIGGFGQVQPGHHGHGLSPSFGVNGGFRFRRDIESEDDEETLETQDNLQE
ncbi:hymenoptaecin-like isoform X1 [Leptopilina boulardi]|uniref:hymenoptaecin-like isoform X1 n=1 Tax=Leptopilina boulardi TaxID=63433 RepID=UPI0021F51BA2|nr:hymenoptaecin-like isoform X1 [Leptopilina boulardi]XP_051160556.1 hymenoptaecin-like isoform X1 [Leptopilina boulardi]